ncbi:MAG: phosphatase PAP2 family protein [Opitutaceae bacterium]
MKRFPFRFWLMLSLIVLPLTRAADANLEAARPIPTEHFLPADGIDWKTILPPPPAPGSVPALADLETVLQVQATRTAADIAWAKLTEKDDVYADYRDVVGPWFEAKQLPVLADFIRQVTDDVRVVSGKVKDLYPRPRPFKLEPTVHPVVNLPTSNSYPSGHSMRAYVWAAVLGDIFTDQQPALYTQAHRIAWARVIGGAHFPSDTIGGRLTAQVIVAELRKSPAYRAAIERCKAEVAPFLLKKAA